MNRILAVALAGLLLALAAAPAAALQDPPKSKQQTELQTKLDAKLKEAWVGDGGWIADFDRAREKAKADGRLIVAYLTRSFAF